MKIPCKECPTLAICKNKDMDQLFKDCIVIFNIVFEVSGIDSHETNHRAVRQLSKVLKRRFKVLSPPPTGIIDHDELDRDKRFFTVF